MASTSTNKQPLLVDRPFLSIKDTSGQLVGTLPAGTGIDPQQAAGVMMIDCTKNDGAVVEYLWTLSREISFDSYSDDPNKDPGATVDKYGYAVNFYLCPSNTVMDPKYAMYVTTIIADIQEGGVKEAFNLPEVTAPVAAVGSVNGVGQETKPTQFRCLYIPKGQALWAAAVQQYMPDGSIDPAIETPLACAQGGYY